MIIIKENLVVKYSLAANPRIKPTHPSTVKSIPRRLGLAGKTKSFLLRQIKKMATGMTKKPCE
jgi:hypothetical protein